MNEELEGIEREIQSLRESGRADAFLLYLHGLVLLEREKKDEAREVLLESVTAYPCNWAAWQALQEAQDASAAAAPLPDHWMSRFYLAANCLENGDENERGLEQYMSLQSLFPKSEYVLAQVGLRSPSSLLWTRAKNKVLESQLNWNSLFLCVFSSKAATAHYNLRQFDEAQSLFESLHRKSPHRIESMDTYSNILYVKEAYAGLSHLAHSAIMTDKVRRYSNGPPPALRLDRKFVSFAQTVSLRFFLKCTLAWRRPVQARDLLHHRKLLLSPDAAREGGGLLQEGT